MKSTWKRAFATLLTIAMLASLLVVPASAGKAVVDGKNVYTLEFGTDVTSVVGASGNFASAVDGYFSVFINAYATSSNGVGTEMDDGYTPLATAKFNAAKASEGAKSDKNQIDFTAKADNPTVTVWWYGPANSKLVIGKANGNTLDDQLNGEQVTTAGAFKSTVDVTASAGDKIVIGGWKPDSGSSGNPFIYKVEVIDGEAKEATAVEIADKSTTTLAVDGELQLSATVTPSDSTDEPKWTTSDEEVATVDQTGKVTGVADGSVTITVTAGKVSDSITLSVGSGTKHTHGTTWTEDASTRQEPTCAKPGLVIEKCDTDRENCPGREKILEATKQHSYDKDTGLCEVCKAINPDWADLKTCIWPSANSSGKSGTDLSGAAQSFFTNSSSSNPKDRATNAQTYCDKELTIAVQLDNGGKLEMTADKAGTLLLYMGGATDSVSIKAGDTTTTPAAVDHVLTQAVTAGKIEITKNNTSVDVFLAAFLPEQVSTKDITFTVGEGVTPAIKVGDQAATLTDGKLTVAEDATVTFTLTVDPAYKLGTVTGATESGGTYTVETTATTVVIPATKRPVISVDKDSVHVSADSASDQHTDTVTVTVTDGNVADVTVSSSADATATATISGGVITITGVAEGTATVTVALTDATSKTIAVEVAAAGAHVHSYGGWTVKTAGNCVDKAVEERTCANTDGNCTKVTDTRETAVDPTNHKGPQSAKAGTAVAATCAAAGHEADTYCEACDTKTADGAVIPKTNTHTFEADKPKCTVCNEAANPDYEGPTAEWDLDFTASEAMAKDATVESVDGVKLTMGAAFGWNAANADGTTTEETLSAEAGMPGVLKGSGGGPSDKAAVPADGKSYLKFDATKDGSLLVAYAVFGTNAKTVYVVDATGAAVAGAGETNFTGNGYSEFDVVSGGTYYVYAGGANIGFYGFSFTADEGGDEPAPDKKTVTFSVGADTQVTDIKVDGVAAELVGGKLTDIAKAAVVTFQAAVTDATKTLKVTGATFADGVYTVTADTVTVTAVAAGEEPGPGPDDPTAPTTGVFTFDIGEMVTAGKLTVETHAGGDPAPQLSELGTEGLFTIITKKSGGSTIEERSDKHTFADGYAGTHQFKTGGSASDMAKLESEGKAIKFTTGAQSTVKVWWVSGSGSGSSLALANKSGEADPVQFYADAEKSAQNVGVITIIENVPAGTNYLYSPDGTARFYKVVVAVGDSKLPDGNEPGPGPDDPGPDDPGKDDPADTAALNDAIKAADKLAGTYTVRADTTVAANVTNGSKYVLQKDKDALDAAIAAAKAVAAKTDATQAEVDKAVTDLNAAMDAFNAAVKTGTKTSSGSTGGGTSIRDDRGETPVTSSTTVTTADGLKVTIDKSSDGAVSITAVNADGEVVAKVSLPATIPSVGYKFVDVPDEHWAAKSINDMAGLGMVKGVDEVNHIFDMNSNVTRGAVATIIYRMANGKSGMENIFDDVAADVWYTDGIAWANKAGVVNGFEDGSFRPDGNITREQLAVMIARFAKIIGLDTTNTGTLLSFKDGTKVQAWAVDGVSWCVANGIINGRGDGTIDPAANATRAEAAAMLDRFVQLLK